MAPEADDTMIAMIFRSVQALCSSYVRTKMGLRPNTKKVKRTANVTSVAIISMWDLLRCFLQGIEAWRALHPLYIATVPVDCAILRRRHLMASPDGCCSTS